MSPVSRKSYQSEAQLRERDIKAYFKRVVELRGAKVLPWKGQGVNGVMDRVVLWPGGIADFIEFKRPKGGKLSALQEELIMWMGHNKHNVWIISNKVEVERYVLLRASFSSKVIPGKRIPVPSYSSEG